MNRVVSISASIVLAGVMLGCGSSSDEASTTNYLTGAPVVISTQAEAQNAIAAASSFAQTENSASLAPSRKAPSLAPVNETLYCTDGGSITLSGDTADTETDSMNVTYTYESCVELGSTTNGIMKMVGTQYDYVWSLTNFSMVDLEGSFVMNLSEKVTTNSIYDPLTVTMDGTMDYVVNLPQNSGHVGYQNFKVVIQDSDTRGSIDGDMSVTSSAYSCIDGRYNFETVETLTFENNGSISGGVMKINDVSFQFNGDSTATVTFSDGTTTTVDQDTEIICNP
jgi:hypothetical protein